MIEVELNPPLPHITNFEMVNEDLGDSYPFLKKEVVDEKDMMMNNENELECLIEDDSSRKGKKRKSSFHPFWKEPVMR